ncbi:prevent-host-death protein [Sciscionella sediminilitoris]|uniref:prevent-host-death protein n=1 Tax=Sciscionella sediminilitoris TaxID=1445613 RepID=UPI0004DF1F43|nr:prevent-host-death protein [Sciscionella sp. SE31]
MTVTHYDSYTAARTHLKDLLDAAEHGRVATVRRDSARTAVVDVVHLQNILVTCLPAHVEVIPERDGWSAFVEGVPIAADGVTFDGAVEEMIDALREYAEDWQDHLLDAPNHQGNWGLVQLIALSDDQQLRDWIVGDTVPARAMGE